MDWRCSSSLSSDEVLNSIRFSMSLISSADVSDGNASQGIYVFQVDLAGTICLAMSISAPHKMPMLWPFHLQQEFLALFCCHQLV